MYTFLIFMLVNFHNIWKVLTMHPHWHWIMRDNESETVHETILSSQCCVKRYSVDGLSRCVPECIHPYHGFREVMTVESTLVFKGHCVVIPQSVRKEVIEFAHETYIYWHGRRACSD